MALTFCCSFGITVLLHVAQSDFLFTSMGRGMLHGFAVWFTVKFGPLTNDSEMEAVVLTTSPFDE